MSAICAVSVDISRAACYTVYTAIFRGIIDFGVNIRMDPLGRCIVAYVIFLILCAFFSVGAAVLNTLRALDEDEEDDSAAARLFVHKNLYRFRLEGAALVCAAVCSGCAWYALFDRFAALFAPSAVALAAVLFVLASTFPTLLLGSLLPRVLAEHFSTPDALYSLARFAKNVALVFVFPAEICLRAILRLTGVEPDEARSDVTEQEILQLVDEGESSGAIDPDQREMIENIFDLPEHTVREVMRHYTDVAAIRSDATDEDILRIISETGYSRYPVFTDDITKVTGVLLAKEYLCDRLSPEPKGFAALVRAPLFVPDSMLTDAALRRMKESEQHMALVVNEYGEALGIVTMEDVLEEIVGSIYDETDSADDREPEIKVLGDGSIVADPTASLEDLGEAAGVRLDDTEGIDTVGALVFSKLTTIPDDGVAIDVETDELYLHSDGLRERRLDKVTVRVKTGEKEKADEAEK